MDTILSCIQPILEDLCGKILSCLCGKVGYMCKLKENLGLLRTALDGLQAERNDVLNRVYAGELKGGQRLATVANWLSQVQTIEINTNQLIDIASGQDTYSQDASGQDTYSQDASAVPQRLSTCGCWSSTCSAGEDVFNRLNEVRDLSSRGKFEVVTGQAPPPLVEKRNFEETFGLDTTLEKTWNSLMKNKMLGIYGMGGVGKTTLLTLINNRFVNVKDEFDVVIWVKVSKDADIMKIQGDNRNNHVDIEKNHVDIEKIQDTIGERLHICDENWSTYSKTKKAGEIRRVLIDVQRRFVLLLDDLWEKVSLTAIGIPLVGREYKVVFTTRSEDVCVSMEANEKIKVECLAEDDAWELFKLKARSSELNDEFFAIAKKIAATCRGLPLALKVIGKTMASKTTVDQWERALETLESCPSELKGTKEGIFQVLKLSYDHLEEEEEGAKLCFQYCTLFPKAYNIKRDELVEYWIGEGTIIDEEDGRQRAMNRGYDIIDTLVEASLLSEDGESKQKVYMHDMIWEMALQIVSNTKEGGRFVVRAGVGLSHLPIDTDWTTVTKLSLMENEIESIPDSPRLPNPDRLVTLFLQNNKLVDIVGKFFLVLSTLVVLDLSRNPGITELPGDISKLVALRYLSLLGTRIKDLPDGLGKLTQLIHLDLESTSELQSIRQISGLLKLQVLRFYDSAAALDLSILKNLESLENLQLLTITVNEDSVLKKFFGCKRLVKHTQGLYIIGLKVSGVSFAATFGTLSCLCNLKMIKCDIIESDTEWDEKTRHQSPTPSNQITPSNTWFKNLTCVALSLCVGLKDVTWLIYAAKLESLSITLSPNLEEVVSEKKAAGINVVEPFQKLQVLDLGFLDELKSIYWTPLSFPQLHQVNIKKCSKLHKLPLNSTSMQRVDGLRIEVDDGWFEEAVWESEATKNRFRRFIRTASTV